MVVELETAPIPEGATVTFETGARDLKVCKRSGKPFKSRNKVNTVTYITVNPNTGKEAYYFAEDGTVVDCDKCKEVGW